MQGRVAYLDGIRALAIAAVLCAHWVRHFAPFGRGGYIGVDIFFVLSGFIITRILWSSYREQPVKFYRRFVARRVQRLYPALLGLVIAVTIAANLVPQAVPVDSQPTRSGLVALAQLTWLSAALHAPLGTLGHTWTLGLEWLYYLLWPVAVIAFARRACPSIRAAKLTAIAAGGFYAGSFLLEGRYYYYLPPARFAELLAGSALALALSDDRILARARRLRAAWPRTLALGAIVGFVLFARFDDYGPFTHLVGIPVATLGTLLLLWTGHGSQRGLVARLLSHRHVTWLGTCSYSLYLWHTQAQHFIERDLLPVPTAAVIALALGITAALTGVSYVVLERPFLHPHSSALAAAGGGPAKLRTD